MNKTYFNWSTGKDSALALYYLLIEKNYSIDLLLVAVNSHYNRVSMHGLRRELMVKQCKALNIPFTTLELPLNPDMEEYNSLMHSTVNTLKKKNFTDAAFGDIFLEDLRQYRENQLYEAGLKCIFPLWKRDTKQLIEEFLDLGFKAVIICASTKYFDENFVGQTITKELIDHLPDGVDPCGENGEFHTFCYDGPIFKHEIKFDIGEKRYEEYDAPNASMEKTGFWFCDLV